MYKEQLNILLFYWFLLLTILTILVILVLTIKHNSKTNKQKRVIRNKKLELERLRIENQLTIERAKNKNKIIRGDNQYWHDIEKNEKIDLGKVKIKK